MFLDVAPANRIAVEEIFGPVVSVTTFRTPDEAVERANNSAYGLAAGVWTVDGAKAFQVAGKLRAGVVWQNTYNKFDPTAAFGGYKESGFGREGGPAGPAAVPEGGRMSRRALVAKTYKLYLGGAFVRSESGRTDPIDGVNVPRGSRKDVRDAVKAARGAFGGWSGKTAYNRGQVLYRFAEALESRSARVRRRRGVGAAVDLLVHYAGWTDKLPVVMGGINPVAAPYLSLLDARADRRRRRAGARRARAAGADPRDRARAGGGQHGRRGGVPRRRRCACLDLGEVAGVSDFPGGVLNLLSGRLDELVAPLCGHRDVNAIIDATGDSAAGRADRRARRRDGQARLAAVAGHGLPDAPGGAGRAQDGLAPDRVLARRVAGPESYATRPATCV